MIFFLIPAGLSINFIKSGINFFMYWARRLLSSAPLTSARSEHPVAPALYDFLSATECRVRWTEMLVCDIVTAAGPLKIKDNG